MPIQQKLTPPALLFNDFAGWERIFIPRACSNYREYTVEHKLVHNVRTTLLRRRFNILMSVQRPYNVVLTLCQLGSLNLIWDLDINIGARVMGPRTTYSRESLG